jgi:hypothetical protein
MTVKAQLNMSEYLEDVDNAAGESSINANMYFELQFATPSQKQQVREVIESHYKEIRVELKNISLNYDPRA